MTKYPWWKRFWWWVTGEAPPPPKKTIGEMLAAMEANRTPLDTRQSDYAKEFVRQLDERDKERIRERREKITPVVTRRNGDSD
jgi:hypothetical protein